MNDLHVVKVLYSHRAVDELEGWSVLAHRYEESSAPIAYAGRDYA